MSNVIHMDQTLSYYSRLIASFVDGKAFNSKQVKILPKKPLNIKSKQDLVNFLISEGFTTYSFDLENLEFGKNQVKVTIKKIPYSKSYVIVLEYKAFSYLHDSTKRKI